MPLKTEGLVNLKTHPDGSMTAQCPACEKAGTDKTKNHLIIYPDGKYGCVLHPGDTNHRKEIWAINGGKATGQKPVRLRLRKAKEETSVTSVEVEKVKKVTDGGVGPYGRGGVRKNVWESLGFLGKKGATDVTDASAPITNILGVKKEEVHTVYTDTVSKDTIEVSTLTPLMRKEEVESSVTSVGGKTHQFAEENRENFRTPPRPLEGGGASVTRPEAQVGVETEVVVYDEGPPVLKWTYPDGRYAITALDWESKDGKPPKPIRFTSTPDPDE